MTVSSWCFKRFERLSVIVTSVGANFGLAYKMEYINFEADEENQNLSSDDEFSLSPPNDNFIDDCAEYDPSSFYRFVNQTRDPTEVLDDNDQSHPDRQDLQPEMFLAENREHVEFDDVSKAIKCANKFKKNLLNFKDGDIKVSFFDAILYGLLSKFYEKNEVLREDAKHVFGEEFVDKLFREKEFI